MQQIHVESCRASLLVKEFVRGKIMVAANEDFLLGSGEKDGGKKQRDEESSEHGQYQNDPSHSAPLLWARTEQ
jgi:hypothetical protein